MIKKQLLLGVVILTMMILLTGCKSKQDTDFKEILSINHELFHYAGTENADQIAVDKNGTLYTATYLPLEEMGPVLATEYVYQPAIQRISVYDLEGNCIRQEDIGMGNGTMKVMLEEEGMLYCVISKSMLTSTTETLYAVDTATWEVTEVCGFEGFSRISELVHIGDYFYVLGKTEWEEAKYYELHPDVYYYEYAGEAVGRINVTAEQPEMELLQIDFPISIFQTEQDTLIIYIYSEENGFGFLEFSPSELTLTEAGWKQSIIANSKFTMCESGYLSMWQDHLYYGTLDGMEAELSEERILLWWSKPVYCKGFAFYLNAYADGMVERFCVSDLIKENKTIRLLMHDSTQDLPYGCGYRMKKTTLLAEQYALKVLAQDKDFDICLLSSGKEVAYNLKENGAFYPLNEVEGVKEYLDACFPYVKETAINEDGDIWMVPVALAIPGLLYNKEYCNQAGVDFSNMSLADFFEFTEKVKERQKDEIDVNFNLLLRNFFGQYLCRYQTFDTVLFREYAEQLRNITVRMNSLEESRTSLENLTGKLLRGERGEVFCDYLPHQYYFKRLGKAVGSATDVGITNVPRLEETTGNLGTITFLAVNPQSDNLEATLNYISSFAKYMLKKKDSLLLTDESTYTDTPFVHEWYELYANGALKFEMDEEVYLTTLREYLNGKRELEDTINEIERRRKIYVGE